MHKEKHRGRKVVESMLSQHLTKTLLRTARKSRGKGSARRQRVIYRTATFLNQRDKLEMYGLNPNMNIKIE